MRFKAVLFDAGGTLLFLDHARIAAGLSEACGVPITAAELDRCAPIAAEALERGSGTDDERAIRYLEMLCRTAGIPALRWTAAQRALFRMHGERHLWSAGERGTAAALGRLRASGIKLGVVSNSDGRVEDALRVAGLRDCFDVVIDSAEAGVEKPDPRIFHLALGRLGVAPAEALHVGDVYDVDVVGARAAGIEAVLVGTPAEAGGIGRADVPTARSVVELADALLGERTTRSGVPL